MNTLLTTIIGYFRKNNTQVPVTERIKNQRQIYTHKDTSTLSHILGRVFFNGPSIPQKHNSVRYHDTQQSHIIPSISSSLGEVEDSKLYTILT